jgi:uncharacterized protein
MNVALLDTNVLLALAWPNHQHHGAAHKWFAANRKKEWATCAFTQLGFVRLSSNPAYTPSAVTPRDAAGLLTALVNHKSHRFLNSSAACHASIYAHTVGHQQVNDAWLVQVAREIKGKLVTLDRRLSVHAVADEVEVIATP